MKRFLTLVAVAASLSLVVVPATAGASGQRNIVQTAASAGQFKTLVALVKQAGLAATLSGPGPFTVFAPTDAAFAKVPKATLTALAHDRKKLQAVLLYHVLKGRVTAATLHGRRSVKTLNGQSLTVRVVHGVATIGGARIVKANIAASNGVIHVIDRVLIPR
ncbi:MAG: fasciclin domain-containing protein [Solirubrobacterales bacterium]|nr:fasciclin domain-containing protein [Solirubrobacterales bacterium]MBV9716439.1 fasciclin domain-containing protein [Solirubrobacterales bacterium]